MKEEWTEVKEKSEPVADEEDICFFFLRDGRDRERKGTRAGGDSDGMLDVVYRKAWGL